MRRASFMLVFLGLTIGSCVHIEYAPGDSPYSRMLRRTDLGEGWTVEQDSFHQIPEATASYAITFRRGRQGELSRPVIVDQLTVYASAERAKLSVEDWISDYIPTGETSEAQVHFLPSDSADAIADGCKPITIDNVPLISCSHIQQHENLVLYVHGMMDGEAFGLSDYEALLAKLDARLRASSE